MIEAVRIGGAAIPLADVFAAVVIRHGRSSADDAPLASTATLSLVNVTRELTSSFAIGDELELDTTGAVPRFRGRITDAAFADDVLAIIAVSSLALVADETVGAVDYPEEAWSSRVYRVLREAGVGTSWLELGGTWAASTETWAEAEHELEIDVGDSDPLLAARPADPVELASYLAALAESNPAAIANLPNGAVLVQELTARRELAGVTPDPSIVAANPAWAMVTELVNRATVEWAGGEETVEDPVSVERFEHEYPDTIKTELALAADAADYAARIVAQRAYPRWEIDAAELLELVSAITIGTPVTLEQLEAGAPFGTYIGLVEGWTDAIGPGSDGALEWTQELRLSPPRLSGVGLRWHETPADEVWADADAVRWNEPELLLTD